MSAYDRSVRRFTITTINTMMATKLCTVNKSEESTDVTS